MCNGQTLNSHFLSPKRNISPIFNPKTPYFCQKSPISGKNPKQGQILGGFLVRIKTWFPFSPMRYVGITPPGTRRFAPCVETTKIIFFLLRQSIFLLGIW